MNYWDIKLYDDAVRLSIQQLKQNNYKTKLLDTFPKSFRDAMITELNITMKEMKRKLLSVPSWLQ